MYTDKIITAEEVRKGEFKFSPIYHLVTERILDAIEEQADILDIEWNHRRISFCTKKGESWDCSNSMERQITKEEFDEVIQEIKKGWGNLLKEYEGEKNSYKLLLHKL